MRRAIVFANGRMDVPPPIIASLQSTDLFIAADGGTHHCKALGITPHVIIGDFDSLGNDDILALQKAGVKLIKYPTHKNETDLELAFSYVVDQAISHVSVIGALGSRWDMTIANLLLAAQEKYSNLSIQFLDGTQEMSFIKGKGKLEIDGRAGDTLSLIPVTGDVTGITSHGLEYPLNDEILFIGSSRGVSNVITDQHARVIVRSGLLLACLSKGDIP